MSGKATGPSNAALSADKEAAREVMEALVLASPDAVVVVDSDGAVQLASPAVEKLFGYEPAELMGQPVEVLVPERFRAGHVGHRREFVSEPHSRPMGAGLQLEGRRKDGTSFSIDVALAPVLLAGRRWVGAFVRDATERRRAEAVLRYASEVNQALLSGGDPESALGLIATRARSLVGATISWIVVPADPGRLVVAAADGLHARTLLGAGLPAEGSLSANAMARRAVVAVADLSSDPAVLTEARDLGLGHGIYVPLGAEEILGTLVLARDQGADGFSQEDVSVAEIFASAAGVALSLGRARDELDELRLAADHDRIARDLHDTVIQRLFALGMGLQGALGMAPAPVAQRIDAAVDALDEVIREIRETIFDLQRPVDPTQVRERVREVAREASQQLGYSPAIRFRGPVEATVSEELSPHIVAVVREALSNVARHAAASSVDVTLEAEAGTVVVRVTDNGAGRPASPATGHGLANMAARAAELGGTFHIGPGPNGGTVVEWRAPTRPVVQ